MGLEIAFWILAVVAVVAAVMVVSITNLFRAALCLVGLFIAISGLYITLSADFLAAVQILVYVGAISILIILSIMLTHRVQQGNMPNQFRAPALIAAVISFGVIGYAILGTPWNISTEAPLQPTTQGIAQRLFGQGGFILPVEIAAMLLLVAIMGAIVLAGEKEK